MPTVQRQHAHTRGHLKFPANVLTCKHPHTHEHRTYTPMQRTSKQKVQCKPLKSPMPPACILYCILCCAVAERKRKWSGNGKTEGVGWQWAVENAVENIVQRARSEVDNDNRANNEAFLMWPLNNGNEDNAHTHKFRPRRGKETHWLQWTAETKSLPNKQNFRKTKNLNILSLKNIGKIRSICFLKLFLNRSLISCEIFSFRFLS